MELEKVDAEKFGIEEIKAQQIKAQFVPMLNRMEALEIEANAVFLMKLGMPETEEKAREVRNKLVKVRTGTALIHKEQKDFYLKAGRYIDGLKNVQIFAGQGLEEKLFKVENYSAIKRAEKIESLNKKRSKQIEKFINLEDNDLNFGAMQEEVWTAYLEKKKTQYLEMIEAEKEAEIKRKEDEKKAVLGQERFAELMDFVSYLKRKYTLTECAEMTQAQYELLKAVALEAKEQDQIGKQRFVEVAKYVNHLADPITSYNFREMTEVNFKNFLFNLVEAEKNHRELNRRKALIAPYSRFVSDKEFVLQLDLEGFNHCVTSLIEKDLEEKEIKAKREERGKKLSAILSFVDDYERLINSTDKEFEKGLTDAQERADKKTEWLRLQATKESEERAERVRLQGIENDRKEKEAKDAKDAEKLAKAPVKKQLQAWIEAMTLENAPVENELSSEILKKFEGFKKWAKGEIEKL